MATYTYATTDGTDITGYDLATNAGLTEAIGAALTAAALQAEGESRLYGVSHIRRGYEDFEGSLRNVGAEIELRSAT